MGFASEVGAIGGGHVWQAGEGGGDEGEVGKGGRMERGVSAGEEDEVGGGGAKWNPGWGRKRGSEGCRRRGRMWGWGCKIEGGRRERWEREGLQGNRKDVRMSNRGTRKEH